MASLRRSNVSSLTSSHILINHYNQIHHNRIHHNHIHHNHRYHHNHHNHRYHHILLIVVVFIHLPASSGTLGKREEIFARQAASDARTSESPAALAVVGSRSNFVALSEPIQLAYNLTESFPLPANVSVRLVHLENAPGKGDGSDDKDDDEYEEEGEAEKEDDERINKTNYRLASGPETVEYDSTEAWKTESSRKSASREDQLSSRTVVFSEAFLLDESQRSGELQIECGVFDRSGVFVFQLSTPSETLRRQSFGTRRQLQQRYSHRQMSAEVNATLKHRTPKKSSASRKQTPTPSNSVRFGSKEGWNQKSFVQEPRIKMSDSFRKLYKDEEEEVLAETDPFLISWPALNVSLPQTWVSLSSLNHASLHVTLVESGVESWCESHSGSEAKYSIEIRFYDEKHRPQSRDHNGDKGVLVNSVNFTTFSQLIGIELMFNCSLFDRAGTYKAIVKSLLHQGPLVAISNPMLVRWSKAYRLIFLGASDRTGDTNASAVLPCHGNGVGIRFHRPLCSGTEDKIRLYRINLIAKSKGIQQGDLVYVTEKRITGNADWSETDAVTNHVTFPCDLFSQSAPGYCFKYISATRSGYLKVQSQICLPTYYNPDGAWSPWAEWSTCSSTCGSGIQTRYRTCDSPSPLPTGRHCRGRSTETLTCDVLCPKEVELGMHPNEPDSPEYEIACPCGCYLTSARGIITYPIVPPSPWTSSSSSSLPYNCGPRLRRRLHQQHLPLVWRIKTSRDQVIRLTYFLRGLPQGGLKRSSRSFSSSSSSPSFVGGDLSEIERDKRAEETPSLEQNRSRKILESSGISDLDFTSDTDDNHSDDTSYTDDKLYLGYLKRNRLVRRLGGLRHSKSEVVPSSVKIRDGFAEDSPLLTFSTARGQRKVVTSSGSELTVEYQPPVFMVSKNSPNLKLPRSIDKNSIKSKDDYHSYDDDDDDDDAPMDYRDDHDYDDDSNDHFEDEFPFPDFQAIYASLPSTANATNADRQSYSSGFVVAVLMGSVFGFLFLLIFILVLCRYNMSSLARKRHVKFQVGQMLLDSCSMERSDIRLTTCQRSKRGRRENEDEMACYTFDAAAATSPGDSPSKNPHMQGAVHRLPYSTRGTRTLMKQTYGQRNSFANCRLSSSYSEPVLGDADLQFCENGPEPKKPVDFKRPDVCPTLDQQDQTSSPGHSATSPSTVPSIHTEPNAYHLYEAVSQSTVPPLHPYQAILNEKDILFQYSIKTNNIQDESTKTPTRVVLTEATIASPKPSVENKDIVDQTSQGYPILCTMKKPTKPLVERTSTETQGSKMRDDHKHPLSQLNKPSNHKIQPLRRTERGERVNRSPKRSGMKRNPSSGGSRQSSCASSPSRKSNSFSGGLGVKSHNSSGCASSSDDGLEYDDYVSNLPGSYFTMDPLAYTLTWSKSAAGAKNGEDAKGVANQYEIL